MEEGCGYQKLNLETRVLRVKSRAVLIREDVLLTRVDWRSSVGPNCASGAAILVTIGPSIDLFDSRFIAVALMGP